ncbi:PmoA family protein [Balneolaceae bacterium ANBcel3]|nr:PmoA family protein [Balneolaceae bacterium ANBcel3]
MPDNILSLFILSIILLTPGHFADATEPQSEHPVTGFRITVTAGETDRMNTIVSFPFPEPLQPGVYSSTRSDRKESTCVQVDEHQTGWMRIARLTAGSTATYRLDPAQNCLTPYTEQARLRETEETLVLQSGSIDVLKYYHKKNSSAQPPDKIYERAGYIHPLFTPNGSILTQHLNTDYPHHFGIWSAWTRTEFDGRSPDFWNVHFETGRVDLDTLLNTWSGPVHAGLRSIHRYTDLTAAHQPVALLEEWTVRTFYTGSAPDYLIVELTSVQSAATEHPLILPEYHYGGVGFRGHADWNNPEKVVFYTADGLGRDGHGTRQRWVHIGGQSDGSLAGVALMGHPDNFRAPQHVRIHPDMPFFNFAPVQAGDMAIEPGVPYRNTYRFVTFDGKPDVELINRLWYDFAYPPAVEVTAEFSP